MCGISGIVSIGLVDIQDVIEKMSDIIRHRGPDGCGYYVNTNLALGHRRLAIIDLSRLGSQPMQYLDYIITYNGEIYNYIELRNELISLGYEFKTQTDTEVVLASYDYWGINCVNHFNGMWAFIIYNQSKHILFCSRDRFGVKPFYYYSTKDGIFFASEIKQFTVCPGWSPRANMNRVYDFLYYGITNHTKETLFDSVYQLPGGHNLIYDLKTLSYEIASWYTLNLKSKEYHRDKNKVAETIRELFNNSVKLRLRSDVKVGSCLSGGIDSSSIVCMVRSLLKDSNEAYMHETVSACYHESEISEEEFIDIVNRNGASKANKTFINPNELFKELDKLIWHQDEPFMSTSIYAQWCVFKCASDNQITVMLDGQGADEYLAGYDNFYGVLLADYFKEFNIVGFSRELYHMFRSYSIKKNKEFFFWFLNCLLYRMTFIPEKTRVALKHLRSHKTYNWFKIQGDDTVKNIYFNANKSLKEMSKHQLLTFTLPTLLQFEDRNSMAFSIESRVPFLDYRMVEYIISLPNNYKIYKAQTKHIFRKAMDMIIPEEIRLRKDKVGFTTPQEKWVKENVAFYRNEIDNSCNTLQGIVDKKLVLEWFDKSIATGVDFKYNFWNLICLSRWAQIFSVKFE